MAILPRRGLAADTAASAGTDRAQPDLPWRPASVRDARRVTEALLAPSVPGFLLRELVARDGGTALARMSEHEVAERVAQLLGSRRGLLVERTLAAPASASASAQASAPASAPVPARTAEARPPPPVPQAPRPPAAAPAPAPAAPPAAPDFAAAQQDQQAAALRLAAVSGVPFCAVCEQARRQRAAAAAVAEAAS